MIGKPLIQSIENFPCLSQIPIMKQVDAELNVPIVDLRKSVRIQVQIVLRSLQGEIELSPK